MTKVLTLADSEADLAGVARPASNAEQLADSNRRLAAAHPAALDVLQAERDDLDADNARLYRERDEAVSERDALQAQVESLKLDAARYRKVLQRTVECLSPPYHGDLRLVIRDAVAAIDAAIKGSEA